MSLIVHLEVTKLKEKLTQLIFEYDHLIDQVCPEIERDYVLEFGMSEYELYKIELEIDKLKRKLQLIQIEINNENEVNLDKIEEKLNEEFDEYEKQLQAQIDEIKLLENTDVRKLSESETKKIKKIYRMLIKRLHPDLHPNLSYLEISLFYKATNAFKKGDLKELESVVALLPDESVEEISEIDNLKELVKYYEDKIAEVKSEYPYNKKELLSNKKSIEDYKKMIMDLIEDRKEDVEKLENKINNLIENV
ncbi:MAG: hypothetical protein K6A34_02755 [Methanobrevibacter sp.]|nr:hypothetical protein [Methanobrevibacter sp.]